MKTPRILSLLVVLSLASCSNPENRKEVKIDGLAQGTYYSITYFDKDGINYQTAIDSFFKAFDLSASVYLNESVISRLNNNDTTAVADEAYVTIFNKSMEVSEKTEGAFDITVMPLVNAWGFGFTDPMKLDSLKVDSILPLVDYRNIRLVNGKLIKKDPAIKIDFNAIAQGYSADLIGKMLESKGIENYLIDVGGEVLGRGTKQGNKKWKVGIEKPAVHADDARELNAVVELEDKALATSGNYRRSIIKDGIKYSHTIDPKTGFPVNHTVLSVSVLAGDCMTADAYATAFMVMGLDKTKEFLRKHPDLDVYMIYSDPAGELKTWASEGINRLIESAPVEKQ
ncbi:MAG: FAD:protein FMN transferase [Bacteroidales bacterium]|nr:FAD:protein FMN transferase [Bacteroidales bacterium]